MDDLISRQAAIETLLKGKIDEDESLVECPAECNAMIDCAIEDIKALPSVQPERKKGKWKEWNDHFSALVFCSECGYDGGLPFYHFCPNCGSEMELDAL